jgi:hypothetical protein
MPGFFLTRPEMTGSVRLKAPTARRQYVAMPENAINVVGRASKLIDPIRPAED